MRARTLLMPAGKPQRVGVAAAWDAAARER